MTPPSIISKFAVGPEVNCPVTDHFAPGVYARQLFMPAGTFVVGHVHKTSHLNILLTGRARVLMDGVVHDLAAPFTFRSGEGVQKVLYILEDCTWMTIHPTDETDAEKVREAIIDMTEVSEIEASRLLALVEPNDHGHSAFLEKAGITDAHVWDMMERLPPPVAEESGDAAFYVGDSCIHGVGMLARRAIAKGERFPATRGAQRFNLARYVNHSDAPNAVLTIEKSIAGGGK